MIDQFMTSYGDVVDAVSASEMMGNGRAEDGRKYANVSISGVNNGYQAANHLNVMEGRFIDDRDIKGIKNVAVVSDKLVNNMFSPE